MNIVILGAGSIGSYVATLLAKEEHNVILLDQDADRLTKLGRQIDVATVTGSATDWRLLNSLLEYEPDFFLALTGKDEVNLVACALAKNLGYPKTISLSHEADHFAKAKVDVKKIFFVDHFISPNLLTAKEILQSIIHPHSSLPSHSFAHGMVEMRTLIIPTTWDSKGKNISSMKLPPDLIVGVIHRTLAKGEIEEETITIPRGEDEILAGDEVTFLGKTASIELLEKFFGLPQKKMRAITLIGGSEISIHIAKILETQNIQVKLLERDEKVCQYLAGLLNDTIVMNHDGKDLEFLKAEGIANDDAFIVCTKHDENNFLLSAVGKQAGCQKVVTMLSDLKLAPILRQLDIHFSISSLVNVGNQVLAMLNEKSLLTIASLSDGRASVFEIRVSNNSRLIGIPLSQVKPLLPKELLIAVVERNGEILMGKGDLSLATNDRVIVVAKPTSIEQIHELF